MNRIKVALGLSGGVDSAVSAYLLKERGFDVSCVYLNCYDGDTPGCRGDNDRKDALAVAMKLELPFQVLDFRKEYQAAVIDYFKREYLVGRTPNPDVVCNRDIKFGLFLDWSIKEGFDYMAMGHYADVAEILPEQNFAATPAPRSRALRLRERRPRDEVSVLRGATPLLCIPRDLHKDQTYFLWAVPGEKFKRVLFPLGDYLKTEVREIARKAGLLVAGKKDSTGICFVGEVRVEDFLKRLGVKEKEGEVVIRKKMATMAEMAKNGSNHSNHYQVIGSHRGVWFYTIGQRHGFEVNRPIGQQAKKVQKAKSGSNLSNLSNLSTFQPSSDCPPLYVIEKDIKKNRLIVGFGAETYRDSFEVSESNWLTSEKVQPWRRSRLDLNRTFVRIRHGGELIPCSVQKTENRKQTTVNSRQRTVNSRQKTMTQSSDTAHCSLLTAHLRFAQRGIAPGQSAVFYSKKGVVLGGGVIQ